MTARLLWRKCLCGRRLWRIMKGRYALQVCPPCDLIGGAV